MTSTWHVDAVVVGGGHHGLVAAALMADAGWDVLLLEANDYVGGAVRSTELTPGYVTDLYSAFYPLGAASPVLRSLQLEDHGLRWSHAPAVLAHPLGDEAAVLHRDPTDTAAGLGQRDGEAWLALYHDWERISETLLRTLFTVFPPVRGPVALLRELGAGDTLRFARFLALSARQMGKELFEGEAARLLLTGNALHADVPSDCTGSGVFGWLLAMSGQQFGFPVPVGGAGGLADALARRAEAAGARILTGQLVERIEVRGGRATGVHTAQGTTVRVRHAVVADVSAPALYRNLLPADVVPARLLEDLAKFKWDLPTVKVNYALSERIPWVSKGTADAGTVHLGGTDADLVRWFADLQADVVPERPFLLFGQMTTADPSRSPAGTESAWGYTHLPDGISDDESADLLAERTDELIESYAPGFRDRVIDRHVQRPSDLEAANLNLVGGAVGGGTAQPFQQLIFRPVTGIGRPETVVPGVFLGSAAAHPGGGVHGGCGALAARAALGNRGWRGFARRKLTSAALDLIYSERRSAK